MQLIILWNSVETI